MSTSALPAFDERSDEVPVTPSPEAWAALSPAEQDAFRLAVYAALERQAELMPEGKPHSTAKISAFSVLSDFYDRIGRHVYLATDLPVLYPGEAAFCPDLIAVLDVEDPGVADTRPWWMVSREGRGIDLALEILYSGDRQKDLVSNLARFARLGIPEYFVYDRKNQRTYGYRLVAPGASTYRTIPPRSGRLASKVLGLELGVVDDRLRFFYGEAEVPEARELIGRLDALVEQRERRLEEEIALRLEAERRLAEEIAAREAEVEARLKAEAQVAELLARLGERGPG